MNLPLIGLLTLFVHISVQKKSYKNYKVYKITPKNEEALKALKELENQSSELSKFQFWNGPTKVGHEVSLMVAPEIKENIENELDLMDVDKRIMTEDVQEQIDAENVRKRTGAEVNWKAYNTLSEINDWLEGLATTYPNAITILKPGKSYEGRDIVGVKLDFSPNVDKKAVFMESNIHAREWITAATTTWILNEFLSSSKDSIAQLAKSYTWYFFPVMNPDGYFYSHTEDRLWRKTRTPYTKDCYGADPNRNWGYQWMKVGSTSDPCSILYSGPRPYSEPSVEVMKNFITSIANNLVAYLTFHSFAQVLMVPYGHTEEHLDNYEEMMNISGIAVAKLAALYGTEYRVGSIAGAGYHVSGLSIDWVKGTFRTPVVFAYELRDRGDHGFVLPAEQIIPTAEETLVSIISIFEEYIKAQRSFCICKKLAFCLNKLIFGLLVLVNKICFDY